MSKIALIYGYWQNQPFGTTWCDLPWALRDGGLPKRLSEDGHAVIESMAVYDGEHPDDLRAGFQVARDIAADVAKAIEAGELPIILCGSCTVAALGAIGGLHARDARDPARTGVAWFDAHADLNTPETTESGLLEGMALSAIAGRAYRGMATRAVGLKPIDLTQTVMVGVRAMDDVERPEFERSDIAKAATADDVADALSGTDETYLHLDMDVHDPVHLAANGYPAPGGPSPAHVRALLGAVPRVAAMSVTGLDPAVAPADSAVDIAIGHIQHVARLHAEQESAQPS